MVGTVSLVRRYLILAASMGDGHLRVAAELRRRLAARGDTAEVVDILELLPLRFGSALRSGYAAMLRHAPALYDFIYRGFFAREQGLDFRPDPLVAVSAPALVRRIEQFRPDMVVSTFHLCGQITGRLRTRNQLEVPSAVVITDFVAHRMWLHAGNDAFICPHPAVAAAAAARTGRPAFAAAPAVSAEFSHPDGGARARLRAELGIAAEARVVLMSAGAWGSGDIAAAVDASASDRHVTLVLCGRNDRLRAELARKYDRDQDPSSNGRAKSAAIVMALGWRDDMADLMSACDVLVENAAGQMAMEGFAVGLPVVTFRPLPGHGRDGCRRMAELELTTFAKGEEELRGAIAQLCDHDSPRRRAQIDTARALFTADPVESLDLVAVPTTPRVAR
jgi:UDP-N-acetylglucosamine:LPS N-acetylglucosamine transferase